MRIIKAPLEKFKKIISNYMMCKRRLRECEEANKFLNEQIEKYNKHFSK